MLVNRIRTFAVPLTVLLAVTGCSTGGGTGSTNHAKNAVSNQTIHQGGGTANSVTGNSTASRPLKGPNRTAVAKGFMPTAVQVIGTQQAYIAARNTLYETIDGGRDWTVNWSGQGQILKLDFENGVDGFALVNKGQTQSGHLTDVQLWHTTDGGTTWSKIADSSTMQLSSVPANAYFTVSFQNREVGIVTITPLGGTKQSASVLMTTDGGTTWTHTPLPSQTAAAAFLSTGTGYALSHTGNTYSIDKTTDGGQSWTELKSIPLTRLMSARIQTFGSSSVWVMASRGQNMYQASYVLYRSTDSGASWTAIINQHNAVNYGSSKPVGQPFATRGPGTIPVMLDPVSKTSAILLGASPARGQGQSQIAKLNSNSVHILSHYFPGTKGWVLFLNSHAGWVVTGEDGQPTHVYRTINSGATWKLQFQFVPTG
ncbi:hypothetical protein [Alicyclobacillus sp. SO9]|uniref:WD40/YVTN/BNR-like repeat-containing protein n=1 Tax=Alicyclobacillus sp. SO9 TaxID=2665646 RepID=UPI0018E8886D|nr:hypothetical protein [Alicyclobacillus sp. SO9]QQE79097.1 hypothetical protein GI364_00805 [Alicyclobacillus sp. SO9]